MIRVNSLPELQAAYKKVVKDMSSARIVAGALVQGEDGADGGGDAAGWMNVHLMLEEVCVRLCVSVCVSCELGVPPQGGRRRRRAG